MNHPSPYDPAGPDLAAADEPDAPAWASPGLAGPDLAPRAGYGSPGRSTLARYRRQREGELAAWARSVPWRAAAAVGAGMLAAVVAQAAGLHRQLLLVGLTAGAVVGWRLHFRPSAGALAWRDGARGEHATARMLRRLHRDGYACFHDLAVPGGEAGGGHLLIGPAGVLLVASKRCGGRITQTPDGRVWHDGEPLDGPLRALRLRAAATGRALGVRVRPLLCVHGARVSFAGITAADVRILPAGRLRRVLRGGGQRLSQADVAALVAHALTVLRPAG
ncbi:MAG TPA: nuclease-related domain-containing protein [Actinomycetes bacterium]|jgi:hypothetical protein|nr:nuclease-related domain-containing protein [Actinomycetes bacterium]